MKGMEIEDKESTDSGSPVESESPPTSIGGVGGGVSGLVQEGLNLPVSMSMEKSFGVAGASGGGRGGGEAAGTKKKRGRPRKFDADGNLSASYLKAAAARAAAAAATSPPEGFTLTTPPPPSGWSSYSSSKRGRGRPSGSRKWQILASLGELAGWDFTPHVVTVYAGEDVAGKILTFSQRGSRGICILSANGCVSNVTIRRPGSCGGLLTYEGRFEILSLTGYTVSDNGGMKGWTGGLSISLASSDGRVIGGGVAGSLTAASPTQIVLGSFVSNGYKMQKRMHNAEPRIATTVVHGAPDPVATTRMAQATPQNIIYATPISHMSVQSQGETDDSTSNKDNPNLTSPDSGDWNDSEPVPDQKPSQIDLSRPVDQQ